MSATADTSVTLPVLGEKRAIRKSRNARRRAIVLGVVQLLMIIHFVQWMITGRTVSPVEPSESMEFVSRGVLNAGAIFFAVALLSTLILGRWFCGWGCHMVMLQDLCGWMMRRVGIHPKPFRSRLLVYVPFVLALYMFAWPAVYRWGLVPLSARLHAWVDAIPALPAPGQWQFSTAVITTDFWHTFPGVFVAVPFILVCGLATVYFLGNKGLCTYACPYGGFFAPFEQYAPGRIRVNDACEQCGHCTAVCTSNVRVHEEVREYGMVVDPGCMKCLDCVSVCPNDALSFGLGRPAVARGKARHQEPSRRPDLTVIEEIVLALVFFGSFVAVRGVYNAVPMLMAAGVAICVTFVAFKLWQVVRRPNVNLHRFRLKYHGSITRSGVVYTALASFVVLLTAHSGAVNALEYVADRADGRVTIARAAVFAASPTRMSDEMAADADRALRHYRLAGWFMDGGIGLLPRADADVRQAWLHACRHDFDEAERLLRRRNARYGRQDTMCRDIALFMRLQMRDDAAREYYQEIFDAEPSFYLTLDGYLSWLEADGEIDEAIRMCRAGIEQQDRDEPGYLYLLRRLSLLLMIQGELDEAIEIFEETLGIESDNPSAYAMLAEAHRRRGDLDQALEMMKVAVDLAPESASIADAMAELLDELGRPEDAATFRSRAEDIRAHPPATHQH
ncbi:MAG: tetratricopeptide repeat protein [Planctomycetes bacterium]|nr:tetratricopeptide repeat protein [Planctomycetota bacterium]